MTVVIASLIVLYTLCIVERHSHMSFIQPSPYLIHVLVKVTAQPECLLCIHLLEQPATQLLAMSY